jgi:hypothetical protein
MEITINLYVSKQGIVLQKKNFGVQGVTWVFDSDSTHELAQNKEGLN